MTALAAGIIVAGMMCGGAGASLALPQGDARLAAAVAGRFAPAESARAGADSRSGDEALASTATAVEDDLLQVVKQLEAGVNAAASGVTQSLRLALPGVASAPADAIAAKQLVEETISLIDSMWLDARDSGFDAAAWKTLCDEALRNPPRNSFEAHAMIRYLLARGPQDPYTRFLSPSEFKSMTSYDVTGVGLNLGTGEEFVRKTGLPLPAGREAEKRSVFVVGAIKGMSAVGAGVRQGDEVLAVNDTDVTQLSPFEAATLIAGPQASAETVPPETTVRIRVRHSDGAEEALQVERRVSETSNPVQWRLDRRGDRRIGYIRLKAFNARAQPEVRKAIEAVEAKGAQELVLDLSDNRGGLVNEGIEIARMFLPDDSTVFITQGKNGSIATRIEKSSPVTRLPLTVIVNERTASASEILSGALHDNCRAVLSGHTTYGKGLIQSVYELQDSAGLVVTVGKYLTPNGTDIDRSGIQPDFKGFPSRRAADDAIQACRLRPAQLG